MVESLWLLDLFSTYWRECVWNEESAEQSAYWRVSMERKSIDRLSPHSIKQSIAYLYNSLMFTLSKPSWARMEILFPLFLRLLLFRRIPLADTASNCLLSVHAFFSLSSFRSTFSLTYLLRPFRSFFWISSCPSHVFMSQIPLLLPSVHSSSSFFIFRPCFISTSHSPIHPPPPFYSRPFLIYSWYLPVSVNSPRNGGVQWIWRANQIALEGEK